MSVCDHCDEPVLSTDLVSPSTLNGKPMHYECGLRIVVGGINHLLGLCSCCGGELPPDDEHVTRRQAARAATRLWLAEHDREMHGMWMKHIGLAK